MAVQENRIGLGRSQAIQARIGLALWIGFGLLMVFYAVMAFEYFFSFMAGEREWWNQF